MEETKERIQIRLSTIWNISNKINSTIDLNTLLIVIMEAAKAILKCEGSALMLMDHEKKELKFDIMTGELTANNSFVKSIRVPLGTGIAGLVAESGSPLIVNDADNDPRVFKKVDEGTNFSTRNLICVPMKIQDTLVGVLEGVNAIGRDGFTNHDLIILNYLSDQAAIAIHNRQLYDQLANANKELANRVKELTVLYDISMNSNNSYDLSEIFNSAMNSISSVLGVERCSLFLYNKNDNTLVHHASIGIPELMHSQYSVNINEGIMGQVYNDNYPIMVPDIETDFRFSAYKKSKYKTNSFLCIPLIINEKCAGVLNLSDKKNGDIFNSTDLLICTSIGSTITSAYNTFKLNQELINQERIKKELETAVAIQRRILPKSFNNPGNAKIAGLSMPASSVGGDYYDFVTIDQDKFALIIADVSGKGIAAAIFAALTRNTLRSETKNFTSASEVFERANKDICMDSEAGMFVTSAIFMVDTREKTIHYVSAGHNAQVFIHHEDNRLELVKGKGVPLGVFDMSKYSENVMNYKEGDTLVLFTDGVVEANNDDHEEFGEDRFYDLVKATSHLECQDMLNAMKEELMEFSSKDHLFDDLTLMVVRF